jgi:hypothetical protein
MRALIPKGGNDKVYTPVDLAGDIVSHFHPQGRILEPCRGSGAFTLFMPGCDWCEIDNGIDFMEFDEGHYDWIITNPPWSKFREFLVRSMQMADNIVFLAPVNAFWLKARIRDIEAFNFLFVEICMVDTPPKPWPQSGFQLAATHIKRWPCRMTTKITKLEKR